MNDWIKDVINSAQKEVDSWPEWKHQYIEQDIKLVLEKPHD